MPLLRSCFAPALFHRKQRGTKNQLAAEAGYDVDRFFAQLRAWSEAHPHAGPVVRNAEELRRLAAGESDLALKDKPPPKC